MRVFWFFVPRMLKSLKSSMFLKLKGGPLVRISKQDALAWFDFCSILSEDDELSAKQQEIAYGVFAQIEAAIDRRN